MKRDPGHRPALLLIHGWGFGPAVWDGLVSRLEGRTRVAAPALPGYTGDGRAADADPLALAEAALLPQLRVPTVIVGWSFGGLPAMRLARARPAQARALVLIASLPRFRRGRDWPAGLTRAGIAAVRRRLQTDPAAALDYVAALSARGDLKAAQVRRALSGAVPAGISAAVLLRDLQALAEIDLRALEPAAECPVYIILGSGDQVIGADCAGPLRQWCPAARVRILAGAGHAPMLSRPEVVQGVLEPLL